ncbi:nitrite reductase large subunit NirB [Paenibacillus glycanilyticus]|uniref:nitrite reductase large subunit NirB n=1 Tax=Paenibacillus glycanilyticus TaxID=126569 RepID=UPI00203BDC06|nr:nitrite reductase large subunit NirB [Paenibacillus glycanilyticus]MCM3627223.1 nitrite reductase large subunit NirB [Paenibacillus glycanilyticus]
MTRKLAVIGNGMAGVRCVEEINRLSPEAFEITIIGDEPHPNYNRIMLSKVLQGDTSITDITINEFSWYKERGIRLLLGEKAVRIDAAGKKIVLDSGMTVPYDELILATGSSAFVPSIPGIHKSGVTAFRNIKDCETMIEASESYRRAAVIGGGLLGLEAARGLLNLGMEVHVVHNASYLMNRQLDTMSADMLKRELMKQGMRFWMEKRTEKIIGRKRAEGLQFSDGTKLVADLIVLAVGISPNIAVAANSGIATSRAIVVDDYMRTSVPHIYAVGECAEHNGTVYGLVAPLYEQGKVLARVLTGADTAPYAGSIPYSMLKVSGVDVFSAGDIQGDVEVALQQYNGLQGTYKKVTVRNGRIAGAVLYGDSSEGIKLLDYLKKKTSAEVLLQKADGAGAGGADAAVLAMADHETVCSCNGVSKGAIAKAIEEDNLQTVEQIRDKTKASGSCGGCKQLVGSVLSCVRAGAGGSAKKAVPVCGCTALGHEEVKEAVMKRAYANPSQVREMLGWSKAEGCVVCRAAIPYYMGLVDGNNGDSELPNDNRHWTIEIVKDILLNANKLQLPSPVRTVMSENYLTPSDVLVRDFGLAAAPAGWEVYVGGHSEHPVKQAQLLAVEAEEETALRLAAACIQWYRETAYYEERPWKWLERIGLQPLREMLLDRENQEELLYRWQTAERTEMAWSVK